VGAAAIGLRLRQSLGVIFLVAIGVSAAVRAVA